MAGTPLYLGNSNYTAISTTGTTTVNQGGGTFYGGAFVQNGTSFTAVAYDIYAAGTATVTNQLIATQTASGAAPMLQPSPGSVGVRYRGSLVVVTGGTPGVLNALWD